MSYTITDFYDFYPIETTDVKDGPSIIEQPAIEIGTGPMLEGPRQGFDKEI